MLGKSAKGLLLSLLCGLCACATANTTAPGIALHNSSQSATGSTQQTAAVGAAVPAPVQAASLAEQPQPTTAVGDASDTTAPKVNIALLLPLRSDMFGAAAQAVRAGFLAAYGWEADGVEVTVLETADGPQNTVLAYKDALAKHDIIVGPLVRADVAALAQSGAVAKPTLALAHPEASADADIALPPNMLTVGLSIEEEARQLANWAGAGRKHGKAFVISTNIAWQRRAARAFAGEWQANGLEAQAIDTVTAGGFISANSLAQLKRRLQEEKPSLLFIALDAFQARQLQQAIGRDVPVYGTSQLNPLTNFDWRSAEPRLEMNGVRFVDLPWLLQSDHPAVMVYPRPVVAADQRANPDLERLYALGIDAFRIAREIAMARNAFELDGVTGKLTVTFGKGAPSFRRVAQPAVYQDGIVQPLLRTP